MLNYSQVLLFTTLFTNLILGQNTVPRPDHVVVLIEENHAYSQVIGSVAAPYINSLTRDLKAALFTAFDAATHTSQPNYIMLFSGSNQGVTNDNVPATWPFTTANFGSNLIAAGFTFVGYSEDLPSAGSNATSSGQYARKHNPWVNWQGSGVNGIPPAANQHLTALPTDFSRLPALCFIIPNMNNDMHNGSDPNTITTADNWLKSKLDGYIQWAKTHNSLFILTWDEDDNTPTNQIATLLIGEKVQAGTYTQILNHYNLLRTREDMFGLHYCGARASATSIDFCWARPSGISPGSPIKHTSALELGQNYPNPFNPSTRITYTLKTAGMVKITVFDIMGRVVSTLVNESQDQGAHSVVFNADKLAGGLYFYTLQTGSSSVTAKLTLLK